MSFYTSNSTDEERKYYARMLKLMGSLSNLFSNSKKPYLASRVTENLFCRYLDAENLSRSDITADARKGAVGVGIKTWVGSSKQKIAEFDAQKSTYEKLCDEEMIYRVADLRNDRISFTMRTYNLNEMVYHCTIRDDGIIKIAECPLDSIDINRIGKISRTSKNVISFSDGMNNYSFNTSKSTLYKDFSDIAILDTINVDIVEDPFLLLEQTLIHDKDGLIKFADDLEEEKEYVYLPLYTSTKAKGKFVQEKSALNQRLAGGRERNPYEAYISISSAFNKKYRSFFPSSDTSFTLIIPNGKELSAKICQEGDKALMTNPNSALGEWLFDTVFKIKPFEPITYEMLEKYGIDSVKITKERSGIYSIDFAKIGSYESFMGLSDDDSLESEDSE